MKVLHFSRDSSVNVRQQVVPLLKRASFAEWICAWRCNHGQNSGAIRAGEAVDFQ